jgi:hypothetical protein
MKRAYLFGAAALIILLIVVAYVSFSREKKDGGVCVRPPPPVVGPTADPVVQKLNFDKEGDEVIPPIRREPALGHKYAEVPEEFFVDDDITPEQSLRLSRLRDPFDVSGLLPLTAEVTDEELLNFRGDRGPLILTPLDEEEMMRDFTSSMGKTPIGGPSPLPSLLQSDICPITYSPLTPFRPGSEPVSIFEETERTFLDASMSDADAEESMNRSVASFNNKRLQDHEYFLRQQRDYVVRLPMDDPLRKAFMREEQRALSSGDLQRLISVETRKPIDISFLYPLPRLRGKDRSPTPDSSGEFGAYAEGRYYPPLDR